MISLNEIENVVRQFDNVVDVAAIGIPHDFYGEDVAVFVTGMSSAKEFDENDIRFGSPKILQIQMALNCKDYR